MLSIFGTFASSPNLEFQEFVDKYETLPKNVLSTAPPSSAFMKDTPGPRYLVLTAYRISIFQKVCFMFLLTNIHEEMWSVSPNSTEETYSPIRESWTGQKFEAVAWWAPSWVEEMRLTRAYWNLFVYWNIYSISPHLKDSLNDYFFTRYRATIADIDPTIGLSLANTRGKSIYEVDEMRCVLFTTLQFLGLPINSKSALSFTAGCSYSPDVQLEDWTFDLIDEHFHWWDKQPKPSTVLYGGQDRASFYRGNNTRATWWPWPHLVFDPENMQILGMGNRSLFIWDEKRLIYLGYRQMSKKSLKLLGWPQPRIPRSNTTDSSP